ncbi:ATPase, P-type (transporting), HAD superfamily, subfamily IC [Streptococcus suis ST3]|uniref:cation-translocating P-type ATPase n=1 Tax=Streptococcus suis TaxID=1307 RepID=UPI00020776FC|nr:cation-translocating P-type ATPase [Streptococcus suis]AEB81098.1 ATPase, P-type (transporting), HAD superfamily, subfamily IC [Streptococcus suis ST3]AGW87006.1 Cation-transporting ATPase, E1-E2 family [Streptococcus suis YB51]QDS24551.1 cation-translocating P-type ATPase [Streptococcus suis]HEL2038609.1 cation-translocating P-type ATPase [Streptococcus suis]HEM2575050.1 cation-translocating P-type ATPase [Streptococcus suis]
MNKQIKGFSTKEVQERIQNQQTNHFKTKTSASNWEIFRRNVFTSFNALNFAIFLALLAVQAWSNLFFFGVIVLNAVSGMLTEWRARRMIDKLNLMNKDFIRVVRDSKTLSLAPEDIVLDDVLLLSAGEQVPSDAIVLEGIAEANEAMLTGESDLIVKNTGAELLSGSYLVSGQIYAKVIHVGAENYANKLMLEAKTHKPIVSRILYNMDKIAKFTGKIIIPFGLALFLEAFFIKLLPLKDSVITSSTALLGMLPKGIALLTITSLLTAVIKLGMKNVLVQEMYSVETLARVDVLCLDKTGTITQGKMTVENLLPLTNHYSLDTIQQILATYIQTSEDTNSTAQAIRKEYGDLEHHYKASHIIPFSSDRKWGAMTIENIGRIFLGAPEMLLTQNPPSVSEAQARGSRVLILALSQQSLPSSQNQLPENIEPLALLEIADPIREDAAETLAYLRSQEVTLKIISGDNPVTVSHIAKEAGFADYDSYIDCSKVDDEELIARAETTAIFGRVSPHQKKLLIQTLKAQGHTTAMTGDGVNDILALREADCSIVMAEGDPATRQIANLVLLDSEFRDIPEILFEGRRVVNNISHIAPIFLIKTIYSFLLGLICIASIALGKAEYLLVFPFIQVQMTLIGQFVEGFPPFILTFERNIRPVEKHFLRKSLLLALPNALMVVLSVLIFHLMQVFGYLNLHDMQTLSYYVLGSTGLLAVIRACLPLTKARLALIIYSVFGFFISSHFLHGLIEIHPLNSHTLPIYSGLMLIIIPVFFWISYKQGAFKN